MDSRILFWFAAAVLIAAAIFSNNARADQAGALSACQSAVPVPNTNGAQCIRQTTGYCLSWSGGTQCQLGFFADADYSPTSDHDDAVDAAVLLLPTVPSFAIDAARVAAGAAYDAAIAGGKTVAEAGAAAVVAAEIGRNESAMAGLSALYQSSVAAVAACSVTGAAGCGAKMQPYNDALVTNSLVSVAPMIYTDAATGNWNAYVLNSVGHWDSIAYNSSNQITGVSIGAADSLLPIVPGGALPSYGGSGGGTPFSGGGSPASGARFSTPSGGGSADSAVVRAVADGTAQISYGDSGGSVICTAVKNSAGLWSMTGTDCTGQLPYNDYVNAFKSAGGGASGGINEAGTPSDGSLTGARSALNVAAAARESYLSSLGSSIAKTVGDLGLSFTVSFPEGGCENPVIGLPRLGALGTVPLCSFVPDLQAAFGWLYGMLAGLYLFRRASGAIGGGGK